MCTRSCMSLLRVWHAGTGAPWAHALRVRHAVSMWRGSAAAWGSRLCASSRASRHRLRRVPYVLGVPRAVVEQRMQREALRNRMAGDPLAEPPYADFFAFQVGPGGGRDGA